MNYKIQPMDEGFDNPFNDLENEKPKSIKISDKGGLLVPRREIFNINRVVYSKRPNGEYTVMAKTQFAQNEIIEICPIIFVGVEAKGINRLRDYVFEIEKDKDGMYGVVLGYGSLYKHSETPNVSYAYNRSNKQMYFMAARTIQAQEELSINYGKDYWDERQSFNMLAPKNETPPSTAKNESGVQGDTDAQFGMVSNTAQTPGRTDIATQGMGQQ